MDVPNKQNQPEVPGRQIRPPGRLLVLQSLETMLQDLGINIIFIGNPVPRHLHAITTNYLDRTAITRLAIALPIPHSIGIHTRNPGRHILALHVPLSLLANYLVF
jgi:hypothetical protein